MMYGALEGVATATTTTAEDNRHLPRLHRKRGDIDSTKKLVSLPSGRGDRFSSVLKSIIKPHHHHDRQQQQRQSGIFETGNHAFLPNNKLRKSFLYTMLNPRSSAWQARTFKWFITIVIMTDLVSFVVSTEPDLSASQARRCYQLEGVTSSIFLVEYIARLATVTEAKKYGEKGPILGRMLYLSTIPALIDLVATMPFFLEVIFDCNLPTLTYLRAFRLLRILKTSGSAEAIKSVYRVIYYNRQILHVALLICVGLVLVTAVLMYYLRPKHSKYSQDFKSLGSTMYLSTLMLTGQGGPEGDLPWYTKGVVLLTGVFSIGMFAIPASMLTWGFEAEAERIAKLAYTRASQLRSSDIDITDHDTWSYSTEDYSTDEEYFKIIAGAEYEEEDVEEKDEARKAEFHLATIASGSGNIPLSEFLASNRSEREEATMLTHTKSNSRLSKLEQKVDDNSLKLDKILLLLKDMPSHNNNGTSA